MPLRTVFVLVGILAVAAGAVAVYVASREPGPLVIVHEPAAIGGSSANLDVSVDALETSLASVEAWVEQGGQRHVLLAGISDAGVVLTQETRERVRIARSVPTASLAGLRDGAARLVVVASRPVLFGLRRARTQLARDIAVRLTPPALAVVSRHHYVSLGGAELVVYRVDPPDSESGVLVGRRFFRGYPARGVAGAGGADPALHLAFFALAFDQDRASTIMLTARDVAGNRATVEFDHRTFGGRFTASRVSVDDRLLARVVPAIVANSPGLDLASSTARERLDAFVHINREVRRENDEALAALATDTSREWLARGVFRRLGRAKAEAPFAEYRTYVRDGEEIDRQVHLGFDLASVRRAPVPAANSGRVVFAGYLGIYGYCVVIDHGMGVQSLYGHLSSLDVERGDRVEKGEVIGRSGATGMAGGDHVHFSVLVGGVPTNPVAWWDPGWVRDRIERKLAEAGIR